MDSYDNLAFPTQTTTVATRYCPACQESRQVNSSEYRCNICDGELTLRTPASAPINEGTFTLAEGLEQVFRNIEALMQQNPSFSSATPPSKQALEKLKRIDASQSLTRESILKVEGIDNEMVAIPGSFGPCSSLEAKELVLADPLPAHEKLNNAEQMKDRVVLVQRGHSTFAAKALAIQKAGGCGLIVCQTNTIWPYTMNDSKSEAPNLTIPLFMIKQEHGHKLIEFLRSTSSVVRMNLLVAAECRECPICQCEFDTNTKLIQMPCQHLFHEVCLLKWLEKADSCPICRIRLSTNQNVSIDSQPPDWFS